MVVDQTGQDDRAARGRTQGEIARAGDGALHGHRLRRGIVPCLRGSDGEADGGCERGRAVDGGFVGDPLTPDRDGRTVGSLECEVAVVDDESGGAARSADHHGARRIGAAGEDDLGIGRGGRSGRSTVARRSVEVRARTVPHIVRAGGCPVERRNNVAVPGETIILQVTRASPKPARVVERVARVTDAQAVEAGLRQTERQVLDGVVEADRLGDFRLEAVVAAEGP